MAFVYNVVIRSEAEYQSAIGAGRKPEEARFQRADVMPTKN